MAEPTRDDPVPRRRRDAAMTRQAILDSAVREFTAHGYEGAGVREIAAGAGVTAMLVNRYFGSKESLFTEAVDASFGPPTIIPRNTEDPRQLAAAIAAHLVARTAPGADTLDPFLLLLRSAPHPRAARIMREATERHAAGRLAGQLDGPGAEERAALANALIAGFWLMRTILDSVPLRDADSDHLTARLTAAFAALLTPEP